MFGLRALLRLPGLPSYVLVSQSVRVAFAALVPGLLLVVADRRAGGYGLAGIAVAALAVGNVLSGPVKGRLIDRYGMAVPLAAMSAGSAAAIVGLVVTLVPGAGWRDPVLVASAFVLGTSRPALGTYSRLLWARTLDPACDGGVLLKQAMTLESTLAGSAIILGPLVFSALLAATSAATAFVVVACAVAVGAALLPFLRAVRGVRPSGPGVRLSPREILAGWRNLGASAALYGALAGAPLVVVARKGTLESSLLISAMAAGAVAAAVLASHRKVRSIALVVVGPGLALLTAGLMLVDAVPLLVAVAGFGAGCGLVEIAVSMQTASAENAQRAEALSWTANAGALGQAAGAAVVGVCVAFDVRLGVLAIGCLVLAAGVLAAELRRRPATLPARKARHA